MTTSIDLNPATPKMYEYNGKPRCRVAGTDADVRATLREYAQAGVEHTTLIFPMKEMMAMLLQMERFAKEIAPDFK